MCAGPFLNSSFIGLGFGVLIIGLFAFIIGVTGSIKPLIINHFITNIYDPFVKSNQACYKELNMPYSSDSFIMGMIEEEIFEPDKITQRIFKRIEKIDKQIAEIERQMRLMQDMQ